MLPAAHAPTHFHVIIRASEGFAKVAGGDSFGERFAGALGGAVDAVTVTAPCQHGRGGKPRKRAGLPALRGLRRMTVSWLTVHNSGTDFSQALPKRVPKPGYRDSRTNEPLTSRAFANETSDRTTLYSAPRDRAEIVRRLESSGCGITQGRASDASLLFSFSRSGNCKSRARFCGSFIDESERGPAGSHQFGPRYSPSSDTGIELAG